MDEYIERESLFREILLDKGSFIGNPDDVQKHDEQCDYAISCIVNAPAADVAPVVHSYWEHKITDDGENIGICHNCKYPVSWFWEQAKYCCNCGAKMDGGADHAST